MKTSILFVCLGNICRSPAAEGIMQSMLHERGLEGNFHLDSAGTYGGHAGSLPDSRMRVAGARRGYDFTHLSRRLREEDFEAFDMIVVMDDENYEKAHRMAPLRAQTDKIFRMAEFCRNHPDCHYIPDPYCEGREGFERVIDLLEDGCAGILDHLAKKN